MTYIPTLFSHLRHKVYLRRYGRPTCEVIFTRSSICRTQAVQILFCIDKARKRSFTEVALNSVLEENEASPSAIDFEWEFYSPNKNIYEQCICRVSQLFHRRFNPGTLRIARSAVRTLRSVRKQCGFLLQVRNGGLWPYTPTPLSMACNSKQIGWWHVTFASKFLLFCMCCKQFKLISELSITNLNIW